MNKENIGSVWSMVSDLGSGVQISVSWDMATGASVQDLNIQADIFRTVQSRQQAKSASRTLEEQVEEHIIKKKQIIDTLHKLDNKGDAKGGLSVAERTQRDTVLTHLANLSTDIEEKQKLLQKLKDEAK